MLYNYWVDIDIVDYYFQVPELFKGMSSINLPSLIFDKRLRPEERLMFLINLLNDDNLIKELVETRLVHWQAQYTKEDKEFFERVGQTWTGKLWLLIELRSKFIYSVLELNNFNGSCLEYHENRNKISEYILKLLYNMANKDTRVKGTTNEI